MTSHPIPLVPLLSVDQSQVTIPKMCVIQRTIIETVFETQHRNNIIQLCTCWHVVMGNT